MKLGYVAGMVWNGRQHADLDRCKLLVVRYVDRHLEPVADFDICIDTVGAGTGEWVLTVGGSSARMTETTANAAADRAIVGIVDRVDIPESQTEGEQR